MHITDSLRDLIIQLEEMDNHDALRIRLISRKCGGKSFDIETVKLGKDDRFIVVNNIKVNITPEDEKELEGVTFDRTERDTIKVLHAKKDGVFPKPNCKACDGCK